MDQNTQTMTTGNSLKQIVLFFLPLLWGNLFQQVYSLVDSIIVGKGISDQALAAVGASGTLNFLILGFVVGMTRGFGVLFSQSFGREDYRSMQTYIRAAQRLCLGVGAAATIVCVLMLRRMLVFMQTPADILEDAYSYFVIILLGMLVTVFNNLEITILQSVGDSKTPLFSMICSSLVNIALDLILIMAFNMGVNGAALATVIAQLVSYLLCLRRVKKLSVLQPSEMPRPLEKKYLAELLKIGMPVACMNSVTAVGGMILQYFVNRMGSLYVAAYSVCMKYAGLFEQFGMSVGLAMMTFVGQNMGAGKYDRIRKGVRQGVCLSIHVNVPLAILMSVFSRPLASMLVSDPQTIAYCASIMSILGICLFPLGWLFVYRYSVQGLGNTFTPMLSGFLEVLARLVLGVIVGRNSFRGIAWAETSAWIGAWLMLMITYYRMMRRDA